MYIHKLTSLKALFSLLLLFRYKWSNIWWWILSATYSRFSVCWHNNTFHPELEMWHFKGMLKTLWHYFYLWWILRSSSSKNLFSFGVSQNLQLQKKSFVIRFTLLCLCPLGGGIKQWCCLTCLSDVCLSVAYIGPKSRTESPKKTNIGTEVDHVTRDLDTTFKFKRSNINLKGAVAYCGRAAAQLVLIWFVFLIYCWLRSLVLILTYIFHLGRIFVYRSLTSRLFSLKE